MYDDVIETAKLLCADLSAAVIETFLGKFCRSMPDHRGRNIQRLSAFLNIGSVSTSSLNSPAFEFFFNWKWISHQNPNDLRHFLVIYHLSSSARIDSGHLEHSDATGFLRSPVPQICHREADVPHAWNDTEKSLGKSPHCPWENDGKWWMLKYAECSRCFMSLFIYCRGDVLVRVKSFKSLQIQLGTDQKNSSVVVAAELCLIWQWCLSNAPAAHSVMVRDDNLLQSSVWHASRSLTYGCVVSCDSYTPGSQQSWRCQELPPASKVSKFVCFDSSFKQ